jgi:hypothetical protein
MLPNSAFFFRRHFLADLRFYISLYNNISLLDFMLAVSDKNKIYIQRGNLSSISLREYLKYWQTVRGYGMPAYIVIIFVVG